MAINITYLISGDTTDEKVRQDLKISSLLKISRFLKFPKVASILTSMFVWRFVCLSVCLFVCPD